jgi:hypothetical protein
VWYSSLIEMVASRFPGVAVLAHGAHAEPRLLRWRHPMQIAHHWLKEIAALRHLDPAYDCGRDCVEDIIALAS